LDASIFLKSNLPSSEDFAANAAKLGQTFIAANRATKAGTAMRDVAEAVISAGVERADSGAPAGKAAKSSLLGKFDFKKMLASKPKAGANA
jgi:pilus assembly protein CpaE